MSIAIRTAGILCAGLMLQACGSTSGTNGGPNFEGNQALIRGGEQVNADGEARTTASAGARPSRPGDARLTMKVGRKSRQEVSRIHVEAGNGSANFDLAEGDTIGPNGYVNYIVDGGDLADGMVAVTSEDGRTAGNFASPGGNDLEYMTFGAWMSDGGRNSGRGGAGSFGIESTAADIPDLGSANYTGATSGYYVDADGNRYVTTSDFSASVNFRSRDVFLGTIDTTQRAIGSNEVVENAALEFAGSGRVSGRGFSADIRGLGRLSGDLEGQFYGPNAKEAGGTFAMRGRDGTYVGAFGADGGVLDPAAIPVAPGPDLDNGAPDLSGQPDAPSLPN